MFCLDDVYWKAHGVIRLCLEINQTRFFTFFLIQICLGHSVCFLKIYNYLRREIKTTIVWREFVFILCHLNISETHIFIYETLNFYLYKSSLSYSEPQIYEYIERVFNNIVFSTYLGSNTAGNEFNILEIQGASRPSF